MLNQRVIYEQDNGNLAVVNPACETTTIEQLISAVPFGKHYKIIEDADLPSDRTERDAWRADFTTYDGVGGAS